MGLFLMLTHALKSPHISLGLKFQPQFWIALDSTKRMGILCGWMHSPKK